MKLLLVLMLAIPAHAEELYCPARYPGEDVTFNRTANDLGMVQSGWLLTGGGMYAGDPRDRVELHGAPERVNGGHDVAFSFPGREQKWLACGYGSVSLLRRASDKAKECRLQVRDAAGGVSVKVMCK